jgi:hypothetical protein
MNKMKLKNLIISLIAYLGLSVAYVAADGHKYTVDSSNYTEYTDMLSPGQITMFSAYPDTYKIHVYDNSGACQIPPEIKAISQTNGTLINDNEGFEVANMGQVPFPNPTEAQHFIWNMRLNSSLVSSVFRVATSTNVQADGSVIVGQQETNIVFPRNPNTVSHMRTKTFMRCLCKRTLDHQDLQEQLL